MATLQEDLLGCQQLDTMEPLRPLLKHLRQATGPHRHPLRIRHQAPELLKHHHKHPAIIHPKNHLEKNLGRLLSSKLCRRASPCRCSLCSSSNNNNSQTSQSQATMPHHKIHQGTSNAAKLFCCNQCCCKLRLDFRHFTCYFLYFCFFSIYFSCYFVTAYAFGQWVICVPADFLRGGSRFSGSLSGIEP